MKYIAFDELEPLLEPMVLKRTVVDESGMTIGQREEFHKLCLTETAWDAYTFAKQTRG